MQQFNSNVSVTVKVGSPNTCLNSKSISSKIALMQMQHKMFDYESRNSLMASGNKPLAEPKLTQIYVTIWRH